MECFESFFVFIKDAIGLLVYVSHEEGAECCRR